MSQGTVYLETSIVSHAAARPNSDPHIRILQVQAREWWDKQREKFELLTSQLVIDEASLGDSTAAAERLALLQGIPLIKFDDTARQVADVLIAKSLMPAKAYLDALHVALAAQANVKYLLTLNCRHIANAHTLPGVYQTLRDLGMSAPLVCTPAEFLGG